MFSHEALQNLVSAHGYWVIALIVGLESMGIPLPGETILVLAAIYAAADPTFNIWLVIGAAAVGSIMGDNLGYWIGKRYAYALLVRYGRHIGMSAPRIKLGQYLFREHGGMVVFLGRFVALLRILAAFLAGVNRMRWRNFLVANAAGGSCGLPRSASAATSSGSSCSSCITLLPELCSSWPSPVSSALATSFIGMSID